MSLFSNNEIQWRIKAIDYIILKVSWSPLMNNLKRDLSSKDYVIFCGSWWWKRNMPIYIYTHIICVCVCDYFFALHICVSLIKFIKQWFPMFSQIFLSIFVSPFFTLIYITLLMNIFPPMVSSAPMVSSVVTKIMTKTNLRGTVLFGWDVHVRVHVEVVAITRVETKKETVSKEASAKWWNWGLSLSVLLSVVSLEHVDRLLFAIPTG